MKKRLITGILCAALLVPLFAGAGGGSTQAADIPVYNDIPAYQQKEFFTIDYVFVSGIAVEEVVNATVSPAVTSPIMEPVQFMIYNTTLQQTEGTITSDELVIERKGMFLGQSKNSTGDNVKLLNAESPKILEAKR